MNFPDFIQTTLDGLKTTYALIDPNGTIREAGGLFPLWICDEQIDVVGSPLPDIVPEFVGQEEMLEQVSRQEIPLLRLENIHRISPTGQTRYLTLVVVPGQSQYNTALVVLVTDTTEQSEYLQQLMQNRNELHIAHRRVAELSYQLDHILRHYLAPEVADTLLKNDLKPELGGELREVSILFADIREFTPLAEQLPPEELVPLLNGYLAVVGKAIDNNYGSISQFQGDNVIAIFNMFDDQADHAWQAVQAGIDIQQGVTQYQSQRPEVEPRLHFGVGINTGLAHIGNVGTQQRYSYTAIGDEVNLTARITGATPADAVWISEATQQHLADRIVTRPLPPLIFKGKSGPTPLFQVVAHQLSQTA